MKLFEIKQALESMNCIEFALENGQKIPDHLHVTEIGKISKHFIDCGGTIRTEDVVNFQLWSANDLDHRLKPAKLKNIIALSQRKLDIVDDLEVEVEYQGETIGKYNLSVSGHQFVLVNKRTDCLAKDNCGVTEKEVLTSSCSTNGNCC